MGSWLGVANRSLAPNPVLIGIGVVVDGADVVSSFGAQVAAGATQIFSYPNFTSTSGLQVNGATASYSGSALALQDTTINSGNTHYSTSAFYTTKQPPGPFTTNFSFSITGMPAAGTVYQSGFTFMMQNTVTPPGQSAGQVGSHYAGDANECGASGANDYNGGTSYQYPPNDCIAIKFDSGDSSTGQIYPSGGSPSSTGMYYNGSPSIDSGDSIGMCPLHDLNVYGINFYLNHSYNCTIVYDGSLITMTLIDTTTNNQARYVWPLNLANATNAVGNYVGFSSGTGATPNCNVHINSWAYYSGYNTRLATPTFSVSPGNYTGTQTVAISGPSGATLYYTTNGLLPTSSSTQYTGALTISANTVLQVVAIESGFTDSLVASGNYVIGTSSNTINFPSGFTSGSLIPVGFSDYSSGAYRIIKASSNSTAGAVWFPVPVSITSFSTTFNINWNGTGLGAAFVIQNSPPASTGLPNVSVTGTGGQISFDPTTINPLGADNVGRFVTVSGTNTGTATISGYSSPTTYYIGASNGSTTATLQSMTANGTSGAFPTLSTVTTTPGTTTGLTFSYNQAGISGGPTVCGAADDALGYGGMSASNNQHTPNGLSNSIAVVFHQNAMQGGPANSVGLYTNGANPYGSQTAVGFTLSGNMTCTLTYSGTTLTLTITQGGNTYGPVNLSTSLNIPNIVGASMATVGLTSSSLFGTSLIASLTSWTM